MIIHFVTIVIQGDRKNREDSWILMSQVGSFFEHESIEVFKKAEIRKNNKD